MSGRSSIGASLALRWWYALATGASSTSMYAWGSPQHKTSKPSIEPGAGQALWAWGGGLTCVRPLVPLHTYCYYYCYCMCYYTISSIYSTCTVSYGQTQLYGTIDMYIKTVFCQRELFNNDNAIGWDSRPSIQTNRLLSWLGPSSRAAAATTSKRFRLYFLSIVETNIVSEPPDVTHFGRSLPLLTVWPRRGSQNGPLSWPRQSVALSARQRKTLTTSRRRRTNKATRHHQFV